VLVIWAAKTQRERERERGGGRERAERAAGAGVAGAGSGPAEVEKYVEEHRYSLVLQAQQVGLFAQRYRVDQNRGPRQKDRGTRVTAWPPQAGPSRLRVVGGGQLANSAAALLSEERSPSKGRV
jgi:hypothetical protein